MSANDVTPAAPANVYAAPTDRSVRARERVEVALHLRVLAGDACAVCGGTGAEHVATPNLGKAALADLDDYLPRATLCVDCHEEHRAAGRGEFKRFVAWSDETIETTEMDTIRARWFEVHGLVSRTACN